jgi:hypothetical protein
MMKPVDACYYPEHRNALDLLRSEYTSIWNLCELYRSGLEDDSRDHRTKVAHNLCHMISICSVIEQEVLYPEVRKIDEEFVFDLLLVHDEINASIMEIRTLTPEDMDYDLEVLRLIDIVQSHLREGERRLLPLIERDIPAARLRPLAADFVRRRLLLGVLTRENAARRAHGALAMMPIAVSGKVGGRGHRATT